MRTHTCITYIIHMYACGERLCMPARLCPAVCDPMDCSLPGSSVHGISRQEYWSGMPYPSPEDLPNPTKKTHISCIGKHILYHRSHSFSEYVEYEHASKGKTFLKKDIHRNVTTFQISSSLIATLTNRLKILL